MKTTGKVKQRYVRFRKRRLFIYIVTFVVLFSIGTGILAWIGIFGSRSELCSIQVSQNSNSLQSLQGLGVNLDYIPLNNFIKNPSFESEQVFDTFVVSDSKEDYIFMTPEEQAGLLLNESALIGSMAKLYTIDERGVMSLIVESPITDYVSASFGSFDEVKDTNWYWTQDAFSDAVSFQNVIAGITTNGNLVTDASSESFSKLVEVEDDYFVGIDESASNVIAVTAKGSFYYSSDGKNFINKTSINPESKLYEDIISGDVEIKDICAINNSAIVLLSNGKLALCADSYVSEIDWFDSDVKMISGSDSSVFVVLANGKIYSSSNALVFKEEIELEKHIGASLVKDISSNSSVTAVLLSDDKIIIADDELTQIGTISGNKSIKVLDDSSILCVLDNGSVYLSTSNGTTMLSGTDNVFDNICIGDDGTILLTESGKLFKTSVFIGIKLEQHIPEESVYAGDICYIEKSISACQGYVYASESDINSDLWTLANPILSWDIYGNGTSVTTLEDAPVGFGVKCARVLGSSDDYHVISQKIADKGSDVFTENAFLRLEVLLKQVDLENKTVKIWLSSEGCDDVGFTVDECASKFTRYSNVFIASDELLKSENEIRLNIAFEGSGELRLDGVYLGLDKYSEPGIPQEYRNAITSASPSVIRLNNLGIGAFGISYDSLFSSSANSNARYVNNVGLVNGCNSLEESVRLVKDSGAFPWFVIGSSADQATIDALLDYLCGSVTSTYGKMRIDNGTAVPWSRQFTNVVFEINDDDQVFLSDVQRSAYVNYVIGLFRQSSYYKDFKDNIVFIDGMNYDGGVMLSFADYHCTSYVDDGVFESGETYIEITNSMYREINDLAPRVKSNNGQSGEYISSLDFLDGFGESSITLGECVVTLLTDESAFSRMILIDIEVDYNSTDYSNLIDSNTQTMLNCFSILNFTPFSQRVYCEVQKPLSESAPITVEEFGSNVGTYLIKSGSDYYLIVANSSEYQEQFVVDTKDLSIQDATLLRYSATGEELQNETIKRLKNRYSIQSGQVMIFEFKNN